MAAGMSSSKGLMVLSLGALVVLALMARPTEASAFVFYSGGCSGSTATLNACGCTNVPINTRGGYRFDYTGQTAAAYNGGGCTGIAHTRFTSSVGQCTPVGWQSVFIQC